MKAFTLIELIIVIGIIALLSTIGLTTYSSVQTSARNNRRKADLKELKIALESYKFKNNNRYPSTAGVWWGTCTGSWAGMVGNKSDSDTVGNAYIPGLAPEFIQKLPRDPRENKGNTTNGTPGCATAGSNCYFYRSNGVDYKILAHCTPEGTLSNTDAFYSPTYSGYVWQVSSSETSLNW